MTATRKKKQAGPQVSPTANPDDVVTINFVEDGFTAFGAMWYRGQTLSVERGTEDWKSTEDVYGDSWLDLTEDDQIERYGRRMFRPGVWAGASFDLSEDHLTDEDRALLEKVATTGSPAGVERKGAAARGRGSRRRTVAPPL
jgi:hypothetical protein